NNRVQLPRKPDGAYLESNVWLVQFLRIICEEFLERLRGLLLRTEIFNTIPNLRKHLLGAIDGCQDTCPTEVLFRHAFCNALKLENEALDALQKVIMQFAGNAFPFDETFAESSLHLLSDLAPPHAVKKPEDN